MRADQRRAADVELDLPLGIRNHGPECGLAPRPRRRRHGDKRGNAGRDRRTAIFVLDDRAAVRDLDADRLRRVHRAPPAESDEAVAAGFEDRKSTRLNSSHITISYAVFCLKKKKKKKKTIKKKKKKKK